eukprot:9747471-Prorocentrum_lima.AAC.1
MAASTPTCLRACARSCSIITWVNMCHENVRCAHAPQLLPRCNSPHFPAANSVPPLCLRAPASRPPGCCPYLHMPPP